MSASESLSPKPEILGANPSSTSGASPRADEGITPLQIASLALPLLAVAIIYWRTFGELIKVWDEDPNYSHGFVVPFFAIGLGVVAYLRHNLLPVGGEVTRSNVVWGSIEIGAGFALHVVSLFLGKIGLFLDVAALIFILRGIVLALGGPKANAAYGFPLLFLIFMAPVPPQVYGPIALKMQAIASIVAANLLEMVGLPVLREGYVIYIPPDHTMEVAGECSGMRSLTAILALAFAIGYLMDRGQLYRWILGLLAAPVAIGVNCLRVFGTGLIMVNFGKEWATGKAHEYEGQVMVGFAALLLVGLAWFLGAIEDAYFRSPAPPTPPPEAKAPEPTPVA